MEADVEEVAEEEEEEKKEEGAGGFWWAGKGRGAGRGSGADALCPLLFPRGGHTGQFVSSGTK